MNTKDRDWKSFYRNQYADHWQGFAQELSGLDYHVRYQTLCLAPLQKIQNGRVLEVGVGRGDLLSRFVPDNNELFGCDLSAGNIDGCRERFQTMKREVCLTHADAERLPYRDGEFDAVYSLSVLFYLPDCRVAVDEMFRITKPGGLVLFDMLNASHITSISNHVWRKVCRLFGRELGRTSLATPTMLHEAVAKHSTQFNLYGNYLLLPVGLPVLKERANVCRLVPSMAYPMQEGAAAWLGHKLLTVARKAD
ncbi:MAG: class I SAM-dependent methyltransferase [Candidatus Hinthialibacter antarcticus]|nr:class I SAM-dependent methyltransferase [Candidatus Hinthialibacter antarcticus]